MICPRIDYNATYEFCAVTSFLHSIQVSIPEIHLELCAVQGQNVTSEVTARPYCRMFKDCNENVHDKERSLSTGHL
jgi:hypothetical protein